MAVTRAEAGQAAAALDAGMLRAAYRHILRSRLLDERMWHLNRSGAAAFWVSGMGHEAVQVGLGMAVRAGHDWVAPYYRDLALSLVLGMTPRDHFMSALARAGCPNGGRQMPGHYGSRRLRIISTGSAVATQLLHAAGLALAARMRGEDSVVAATVGDGGTSEGDFHEALNFAGVHRLPLVCVVENNGYAISVPWRRQMPIESIAERARGYGMTGVTVDGGDYIASYRACKLAVERARRGEGPSLIDAKVQRLVSHSSDDDQRRYRPLEEIEADRRRDCAERMRTLLEEAQLLQPGDAEEIRAEIVREIDRANAEAEAAPLPEPESALLHVLGSARA